MKMLLLLVFLFCCAGCYSPPLHHHYREEAQSSTTVNIDLDTARLAKAVVEAGNRIADGLKHPLPPITQCVPEPQRLDVNFRVTSKSESEHKLTVETRPGAEVKKPKTPTKATPRPKVECPPARRGPTPEEVRAEQERRRPTHD